MRRESGSRQAHFTVIEGCDECISPGNRMGTLDFGAGKDVVERGLNGDCVLKEMPIEI
jgi:hypothetical protein